MTKAQEVLRELGEQDYDLCINYDPKGGGFCRGGCSEIDVAMRDKCPWDIAEQRECPCYGKRK